MFPSRKHGSIAPKASKPPEVEIKKREKKGDLIRPLPCL
jgi:hypothetical protein